MAETCRHNNIKNGNCVGGEEYHLLILVAVSRPTYGNDTSDFQNLLSVCIRKQNHFIRLKVHLSMAFTKQLRKVNASVVISVRPFA
jgi:hypothetical protein